MAAPGLVPAGLVSLLQPQLWLGLEAMLISQNSPWYWPSNAKWKNHRENYGKDCLETVIVPIYKINK